LNKALLTAEAAMRKVAKMFGETATGKGVAHGSLWWMNRELEEMKKYSFLSSL